MSARSPGTQLSVAELLRQYGNSIEKAWEHDRLNTVGASEVGQCARKTWFSKHEISPDEDYVDRFGAKLRGDLIETYFWVPGLEASLPPGVSLVYAGSRQRTLTDGYLSATTDGVLVGVDRDALAWAGIDDIGPSGCINLDCKSIDPRATLHQERPEHSFQVQTQMGLLRHATPYKPDYSLLTYVDASFLDDIEEFAVKFDPEIYEVAQARARLIMTSYDGLQLRPEGKMSGGRECKYCPFASHCADVQVAGIPAPETPELTPAGVARLKDLRDAERIAAEASEIAAKAHAEACEVIKEFLRDAGVRGYRGVSWSVSYAPVKGRSSLDTEALEEALSEAGHLLAEFQKEGRPGDRLTVK